jgi:hypothetical protein
MARGGQPQKRIAIPQITTNKKRMINLLLMGIPPYMFYIYKILDSNARKIFQLPSPHLSPRGEDRGEGDLIFFGISNNQDLSRLLKK